ncbi:MAG: PH domain-containing protein [Nocardioides sp.]|jgi:hypothetical protein
MPADSDLTLPHTWRPFGVRMAVAVFGGATFITFAMMWVGFGEEIRSRFVFLEKLTMLAIVAALAACLWALGRSRVTAAVDEITVVNGFKTRSFAPAQVVAVHLPAGAPWATLDLADGNTVSAMGIQGSDGARARRAVHELRTVLDSQD